MSLTLRQIDAFRAVMAAGTLTEAANHLGISQPAISRLIADLETEIGYQLFERVGRRIVPTAEADILIEEVKRALIGMEQIRETAIEIGRFRYARLRLLTIPSIPQRLVAYLIAEFTRLHPDTFISVDVKQPELVMDSLMTHQCDLAVVSGLSEHSGCISDRLLETRMQCILPARHALAGKVSIEPGDLRNEIFISLRPDDPMRNGIDMIFDRYEVQRVLRYEARTPDLICSMVGAGLGVSIAGLVELPLQDESGAFTLRPFTPAPPIEVSLIWSRHRKLPVMADAFAEIARTCLKAA